MNRRVGLIDRGDVRARLRPRRHDISAGLQNIPQGLLIFGTLGEFEGEASDRYGLHFYSFGVPLGRDFCTRRRGRY